MYLYTKISKIYIQTHIFHVYIYLFINYLGWEQGQPMPGEAQGIPNLLTFPPRSQNNFINSQKNPSKPTEPQRQHLPPQECDVGTGGLSPHLLHSHC